MPKFPFFRSPPWLLLTIVRAPETFLTFSRIVIFFLVDPVYKQYCTVIHRETRGGKLLLTVETEANWDSTSTNERSSSLVGSLVRWALHASTRDLYNCLVCSSRPSTKIFFPRRTPFQLIKLSRQSCRVTCLLKVLTNEKRGGVRVISFDRPPFKLLSRKFSKESVQTPSCERHKTTQRTPFSIICKQLLIPNNAIVSGCDTLLTS
jgi:hypothetical protein